jgi:hypothetical protein
MSSQRVLWIMSVGFVVAYGVSLSTLVVGLARMKGKCSLSSAVKAA